VSNSDTNIFELLYFQSKSIREGAKGGGGGGSRAFFQGTNCEYHS
jgi:hypothetical protein